MDNDELKDEIGDIKQELKAINEVLIHNRILEEKLNSSNRRHDEGRKVLHKRMDVYAKVFFWLSTTIATGMVAIIWTLLDKVLK